MDLTEQNLETISSIRLHNMTTEELVAADRTAGSRLHFTDSMWWREVKPCFYLPANFMTGIAPRQAKPEPWLALGGYHHMVPPASRDEHLARNPQPQARLFPESTTSCGPVNKAQRSASPEPTFTCD